MTDLKGLLLNAHDFVASKFPFAGTITFRIGYQLPSASETTYALDLDTRFIEVEEDTPFDSSRIEYLAEAQARYVTQELIPLLKKNVFITSLSIKVGEGPFYTHVYDVDFDLGTATALKFSQARLRFVYPKEGKDYNTYSQGTLSDLLLRPLSARQSEVLSSFEQRFLLLFAFNRVRLEFLPKPESPV
jgi:hypothetical protein